MKGSVLFFLQIFSLKKHKVDVFTEMQQYGSFGKSFGIVTSVFKVISQKTISQKYFVLDTVLACFFNI